MSDGTQLRWLLRRPSVQAEALVFCVPYLGSGASMFHAWPRQISAAEVCPVQLPGRENRIAEQMPRDHAGLVESLAMGLRPHLDRPFVLFGHCASAYLAYEVARELTRAGAPRPEAVVVSSMPAPAGSQDAAILTMDETEIRDLVAGMAAERGLPDHPELLEMALQSVLADLNIYRSYQPEEASDAGIALHVVGWTRDRWVAPSALNGWPSYGPSRIHTFEGDHWSFLAAPEPLQQVLRLASGQATA